MKKAVLIIGMIIVFQGLSLWACHAKAAYQQVSKAQAIAALKKAPRSAEVYQCFKRAKSLDCKRVKLAVIPARYDLKLK